MRRLLGLVLLLAVLGALAPAALADPLVPERPVGSPSYGEVPPLYDQAPYEPWDYTFQGTQADSVGYVTIYFWMNLLLVGKAWALKLSLRLVEYALHFGFLEPFITRAGSAMQALGDLLWSRNGAPLVVGALALAGFWAMLLWLRGRVTRSWGVIGSTTLILMLLAIILADGTGAARTAVGLARGVSSQIYTSVNSVGLTRGSSWDLVGRSGDSAWRSLVYEPWLTGQLAQAGQEQFQSAEGLPGGRFLEMTVEQRRQICFFEPSVRNVYCPWWETSFLPRRMTLAIWTSVATMIYAGAISLLAGGVILAQILLLFLLVLSPVWLLVALWWPGGGMRLMERLLLKFAGALVTQAVLTATLAVLLLFSEVGLAAFGEAGWMFQSILLAGLGGLAIRYRYAWTMPLSAVAEGWEGLRRRRSAAPVRAGGGSRPGQSATVEQREPEATPEAVPVFATLPAPPPRWQVQPTGPGEFRLEQPRLEDRLDRVQEVGGASQVASFRTQMVMVREQLAAQRDLAQEGGGGSGANPRSDRAERASRQGYSEVTSIQPPRPKA